MTRAVAAIALLASVAAAPGCRRSEAPAPDPGRPLSEQERRGREIYRRGRTTGGSELEGVVAGGQASLSGAVAPCARCHGADGSGTSEGGVEVPRIDRERLFRPAAGGPAARPAYDDEAVARLVKEGVGAAGRPVHPVMPRYPRMADSDVADLVAYLHRLGDDRDPGVRADALVVGAALPLTGPLAGVGAALRPVLEGWVADVNAAGGVYRRRLELRVEDSAGDLARGGAPAAADAVDRLLDAGVFALVGNLRAGAHPSDARLEREGVPLVGPVGLAPGGDEGANRMIFYVYPGPETEARVLVQHLAQQAGRGRPVRLAVVHSADATGASWLRGVRAEAERRGLPRPEIHAFTPGGIDAGAALAAARRARPDAVFFAGPPSDFSALAAALARDRSGFPVYAPASLAGRQVAELPREVATRVLFSYPALVADAPGPGLDAFLAFLQRHRIEPQQVGLQMNAYASAALLVEGLKAAGADVSRDKLKQALERFRDFDPGVSPPITYGSDRRIGIAGAYVVGWDAAAGRLTRRTGWIELTP